MESQHFKKSFFISLIYVSIGTIAVLSMYPGSFLSGDWMVFVLLATLPVNFISVGVMYADSTAVGTVLIIQIAFFFLCWFIINYILKIREEKSNNQIPPPSS